MQMSNGLWAFVTFVMGIIWGMTIALLVLGLAFPDVYGHDSNQWILIAWLLITLPGMWLYLRSHYGQMDKPE